MITAISANMEQPPNDQNGSSRESAEVKDDLHRSHIEPMYELLGELSRSHPDAYEAFGGQAAAWEVEELRPKDTQAARETLTRAYSVLKELQVVAGASEDEASRMQHIRQKVAEFDKVMWDV